MAAKMMLTYQTRFELSDEQDAILQHCACLMNVVERSLFAEVAQGNATASCKNHFLKKFNITARQFNACRVSLEGKIDACRAGQERAIDTLNQQITSLDRQIQLLEKKPSKHLALHQKKRRRAILQQRLALVEEDRKQKRIRLCFGGKKLFNAQYHLEKNGFSSHLEWKNVWKARRNSEFFVLGSKDESSGNQTCSATLQSNGKLCFRLRLPKALEEKHGKYITISDVVFAYGHNSILAALNHPEGQAISYRFKRDTKSWTVFVSTALQQVESISQKGLGVIGIDLNTDHVALVETDRFGNPIRSKILSWVSYGKTKGQLKAITRDLCKEIVDWSKTTKKPLVIEDLDFQKKKLSLKEEGNKKFSRLLSHFAYGLFFMFLNARAFKEGCEIHRVNPAFTSIIGRINYSKRYGLSIHLAAALCIARRHQKFSEAPCPLPEEIPDGKGSHVAFVLPARNRTKHVWHFWGQVKKKIKTVLAAHFQAKYRSLSPPSPTPVTAHSS
jgi:IS605 OrfB family transposase